MRYHSDGQGRRFFAVSSLGGGRWYWVVWPSLDELESAPEPILSVAQGIAPTKEEAVLAALDAAAPGAKWIAAKYAKSFYRSTRTKKDAGVAASPAHLEFLFQEVRDEKTGAWQSRKHKVARATAKYVHVEQDAYHGADLRAGWRSDGQATFRLDRAHLERRGWAFVPVSSLLGAGEEPIFWTRPQHEREGWRTGTGPDCLQALGLAWPCTRAEVRLAYRALAKDAHPDAGGDHARFIALQEAYEQALGLCEDAD